MVGSPIDHSLSPAILNAAFAACDLDWVFVAFDVPMTAAAPAVEGIRALGLAGASVTMPLKEPMARLVDRLGADAAVLGAVNCIVRDGGDLVGESTDGPGFIDALADDAGYDVAGRHCVVIGAGGAARAVVLALARAGAGSIGVVNRTESRAEQVVALAGGAGRVVAPDAVADADLIVNATPVGMLDSDIPLDPQRLAAGQVVVDLIYHPAETALLAAARARGAHAVNGLGLLVHQAAHSFRRWTGVEAPLAAMWAAADAARAERR